jgi:hypothetical protein
MRFYSANMKFGIGKLVADPFESDGWVGSPITEIGSGNRKMDRFTNALVNILDKHES